MPKINPHELLEQPLPAPVQINHDRLLFHFENTPIGYIKWDAVLGVISMSKRAEEILGWTAIEYRDKGMDGLSQVYKDDLPAVKEMCEKFHTGEWERMHIQNRNMRRDGQLIWCEWYNSVEKDTDGKLAAVISLVQDITATKEDQEKIKKAGHLHAFISQVNQKIVRVASEKELFRNACSIALAYGKFKTAWIGLYHVQEKELSLADECGTPKTDLDKIRKLSYQEEDPWGQVRSTGNYYICRYDNPSNMGICAPFTNIADIRSCMILPIKKAGEVFGTLSLYSTDACYFNAEEIALLVEVTSDISFAIDMLSEVKKQKATAARMFKYDQEREFDQNNLKALINNTKDLLWSVDTHFKLITFNEPFSEMVKTMSNNSIRTGSTAFHRGFSNKTLDSFKSAYERAFLGEAFTEIIHTEQPFEIWSEISYCPISNGTEIVGAACHSHDITESKIAELERIRITNDLIQRNKNLEQFGYIVSHNLRSPVANILGVTNLMNQPGLSEAEKSMLGTGLNETVTKLDNVVKDLTNVLQVKSEQNWIKEKVIFSELVEDVKNSIYHLIASGGIDIRYDFSAVNQFTSVKSYLHSIFYNLISNSIKYRRQDERSIITITSYNKEQQIGLIFSDNGMGIDLEKRGGQVFGLYKTFSSPY